MFSSFLRSKHSLQDVPMKMENMVIMKACPNKHSNDQSFQKGDSINMVINKNFLKGVQINMVITKFSKR